MAETKVTKDLENKTLIIERLFDASKEKLWKAYADKAWFEKWWGPEGWETTTKEFSLNPGGKIHYCMKCVDENQGEFFGQEAWGIMHIEVTDEPNSFSARDYFSDESGAINQEMPGQQFVVEFIEESGQTCMVNKSIVESAEQLEELIKMGMVEGFSSQLNRLDQLLEAN